MRYERFKAVNTATACQPHRALIGLTPLTHLQAHPNAASPESQAA